MSKLSEVINKCQKIYDEYLQNNRLKLLIGLNEDSLEVLHSKIIFADSYMGDLSLYIANKKATYKILNRSECSFTIFHEYRRLLEFTEQTSNTSNFSDEEEKVFYEVFKPFIPEFNTIVNTLFEAQETYYDDCLNELLEGKKIMKVFKKEGMRYMLLDSGEEIFINGLILDIQNQYKEKVLKNN